MTIKNGDLPAMPMWCEQLEQQLHGLTKREYFAALAMQGMLVNMGRNGLDSIKQVVNHAVCAADTLLAELEDSK